MNFDEFHKKRIEEDLKLTDAGREIVSEYQALLDKFRDSIQEDFGHLIKEDDLDELKNRMVVNVVSTIVSNKMGNDVFDDMYRMDVITQSGTKSLINTPISNNDTLIKYFN